MPQQSYGTDVEQRISVLPYCTSVGNILSNRHVLLAAVAFAVTVEIESDGGDARLGKPSGQLRYGDEVLARENVLHQYHHRTAAGGGVEPLGQRHLIGNIAFGTVNEDFLRATSRQRQQSQHNLNGTNNKLSYKHINIG